MPKVTLKNANEPFDILLRRFKAAVEEDDRMNDYRKHEFFERPSIHRKRAKAIAVKRAYSERMSKVITRLY